MEDLSVSYIFGQAWDLTRKHLVPLLVATLLLLLITGGINFYAMIPPGGSFSSLGDISQPANQNPVGSLVSAVVSFIFSVGLLTGYLRICRNQGTMDFGCFNRPFSVYLKFFFVSLLVGIIVVAGLVFLIVPGIYLAVRLGFSSFRIIDDPETGVIEALKYSWNVTRGHVLELIGLGIVALFIYFLGYLCCCIGVLVAAPVVGIAATLVYLVLGSQEENLTE